MTTTTRARLVEALTDATASPETMYCFGMLVWGSLKESPEAKELYDYATGLTEAERDAVWAEARAAREALRDSVYLI